MMHLGQLGALSIAIAITTGCSSGGNTEREKTGVAFRALTAPSQLSTDDCSVGRPCVVEIVLPAGLAPGGAWVAARQKVTIGDGLQLSGGTVASVGTSGVYLGTDVVAQNVISQGAVELRDRASITDKLASPLVPVRGNQTLIPGDFATGTVQPFGSYLWAFAFPPDTASPVTVNPGQTVPVSPGNYKDLVVQNGATIVLTAGNYTFRSVQIEPDGHVKLPSQHVLVNVASSMTLRGSVEGPSGTYDWTVVYGSKNALIIEKGFKGTLLAPRATLTLRGSPATYSASLYANELIIEAGARFAFVQSQVPALSRGDCAQMLALQQAQPNAALSPQLAFDMLRLCQAPGIPECYGRFMAAVNTDRYAAALRYMAKTFDTGDHLALVRDRDRKALKMRKDSTRLASYCQGDSDGDLVPDGLDNCANTPPLTPTDDNGCTSTGPKPIGPIRDAVDNILAQTGILHNPACDGAPEPQIPGKIVSPIFGGATGTSCSSSDATVFFGSNCKFIVNAPGVLSFAATWTPTSGACPVWYEIRATVFSPSGGSKSVHYSVPVSHATLWNPSCSDGTTISVLIFSLTQSTALPQEQLLASLLVPNSVMTIEARALDGSGRFSPWTTPQIVKGAACQ